MVMSITKLEGPSRVLEKEPDSMKNWITKHIPLNIRNNWLSQLNKEKNVNTIWEPNDETSSCLSLVKDKNSCNKTGICKAFCFAYSVERVSEKWIDTSA